MYVNNFGDGLIQFPGDSKAAVAALDVDFRATDSTVGSAMGLSAASRNYWSGLYAAWRTWADPVINSWDYNPLSAAAFVKQSEIADWRAKLRQQQGILSSAGAADVPMTLGSEQDKPFSLLGFDPSTLIYGAVAIGVLFVLVPRILPKK